MPAPTNPTDQTSTLSMSPADQQRRRGLVRRVIANQSYCTLATASPANRPHVAGVLYAEVDGELYIDTFATSRKARNVAANPLVAVCIPIRKYPFGPPFSVQFQGQAQVVATDDPRITKLVANGSLKPILVNGGLAGPNGCVLQITPGPRVATYGLGVPLRQLIRDPLAGSRTVEMSAAA